MNYKSYILEKDSRKFLKLQLDHGVSLIPQQLFLGHGERAEDFLGSSEDERHDVLELRLNIKGECWWYTASA